MRPHAPKQLDLGPQRVRELHVAAMIPERRVAALGGLEVQDEKIADALVLHRGEAIVFLDVGGAVARTGNKRQQPGDPGLHQMQAGRLQRLESAAGAGDAVLVPERGSAPAGTQKSRLGQRRSRQIRQQRGRRFVIAEIAAGVDIAAVEAALQRSTPAPAARCAVAFRIGCGLARDTSQSG